ncbi:MAG: Gfo/Idh/MocA family oxidoreductase [Oscillospiraceae bacterium]|nr:Gfo/Idh/MocA family oxidoreductase [Oscillospiraceae bacterium]
MSKFKWAILGPGAIANKFADDLTIVPDAELYAVGSRNVERADDFAKKYNIPKAYGSYEEMVKDKEIDCVYISTPHPMHIDAALLCIDNGLNVLCEKPFAMNKKEAQAMIDAAQKKGVFIMEAHWTRFLPAIRKTVSWIKNGKIGDVRMIHCDFSFRADFDPESRLLKKELGGGGLLDVGCYTLSMATMIFGNNPDVITSVGDMGATGVDEQTAMLLKYGGGQIAVLSCGVRTSTYHTLNVFGERGSININGFWCADSATLKVDGEEPVTFTEKEGNGYNYEAIAVMEAIHAGKKESNLMTHAETLAIAELSDTIREQLGLRYLSETSI